MRIGTRKSIAVSSLLLVSLVRWPEPALTITRGLAHGRAGGGRDDRRASDSRATAAAQILRTRSREKMLRGRHRGSCAKSEGHYRHVEPERVFYYYYYFVLFYFISFYFFFRSHEKAMSMSYIARVIRTHTHNFTRLITSAVAQYIISPPPPSVLLVLYYYSRIRY